MEVRQLQIFSMLAEELNFTRTARRVHTVQSNVTTQIKMLEAELGVRLFDRLGRRVVLTEAGRRFQPFAMQALNAMDEGKRALASGSEPSGPLRIGAPESVLTYRLPTVVNVLRKRFPRIELIFTPHVGASVFNDLEAGKIDCAFHMCDAVPSSVFCSTNLYRERILLLSHPEHALAHEAAVKPGDLSGKNLLLTEYGCAYRSRFDRILANQRVRPGHITEFSSIEAIKQCIAAGMGIALLPAIAVVRELREKKCTAMAWAGPSLDVATYLTLHHDKWISPSLSAFRDVVNEVSGAPSCNTIRASRKWSARMMKTKLRATR
jgi:DNA-binding transcriptional LysR family regulator